MCSSLDPSQLPRKENMMSQELNLQWKRAGSVPRGKGMKRLTGWKTIKKKKTKPNKQYYQYPWFLANQLWIRISRMRKACISDWWHFVLPTQTWNVLIRQSVLFCHEAGRTRHVFSILEECSSSEKECFLGCKFQKSVRPG